METSPSQTDRDVQMINRLAQVHMLFGMNSTALHFLELSNWLDDRNVETLKLIARCYFRLKSPQQVLHTLDRLEILDTAKEIDDEERILRARSYAILGDQDSVYRALNDLWKK